MVVGLGLSNQWGREGDGVVQLPLITMGTEWQSQGEHKSGALGQPPVFKERRGARIPGRAGGKSGRRTYFF